MATNVLNSTTWYPGLEVAALSDVGMRRTTNQDAHRVVLAGDQPTWLRRGHLFVVADGMGAHAAGELASELVAGGIPHHYQKYSELSPPEAMQRAFLETNAEVHRRGQENPEFHNMGTTASVLLILPQGALVAHVGDSRVYRLRGDLLEQLTFDHSLVWEMKAAGQLSSDNDLAQIPKNVITRSLGPNPHVPVDFEGPYQLQEGDTFLLCSDGLTGQVQDEEIGAILGSLQPEEAVQVLVDLANLRGGPDNTTVVVARIVNQSLVTSSVEASRPLTIGADRVQAHVHPAYWVVSAACLLMALGLTVAGLPQLGLAAAVAGILAAATGWVHKVLSIKGGVALTGGRRLGKGPHARAKCPADAAFVDKLASIVEELREVAIENGWIVRWSDFDTLCERADSAAKRREFNEAVQGYARAVAFMMNELREQKRRGGE